MSETPGARTVLVPPHLSARRSGANAGRVTNVELFFDLVYVFAVTQLSHTLLGNLTGEGVLQTTILLAVVWEVWAYTTWATNFLDPARNPVRLMLLAVMLGSLVMSSTLPKAFGEQGLLFGAMFAAISIGRVLLVIAELRDEPPLKLNFERILVWAVGSCTLMVLGGLADGHAREIFWAAAIGLEALGAAVAFAVPGTGRATTTTWEVLGDHFAERCQAFVLIALGESVVVIGGRLADIEHITVAEIGAFLGAFLGSVGLWWVYFAHVAEASVEVISRSADPGRIARGAFHMTHPVIIAGIIATAAGDERVLEHPLETAGYPTAWLTLGGTALFLLGHAIFIAQLWQVVPWARLTGSAVLLALVPLAPHASGLTLGVCSLAVIVAVALADRVFAPT